MHPITDSSTLRVMVYRSFDELAHLRAAWSELAKDVPFRSPAWLESAWHAYRDRSPGASPFILAVVNEDGRLLGIAPWCREKTRWGQCRVSPLGGGGICSEYVTLVTAPECETIVAQALAQWLVQPSLRTADAHWDKLEMGDVYARDVAARELLKLLAAEGEHLVCRRGTCCWRVPLSSTWEEYLGRLSKSHRKQVRQATQRLLDSGSVTYHTVRTPAELRQGIDILVTLHQNRHTRDGSPGCFAASEFERFIRAFGERWLPTGNLRLCWLELAGRPIAAEFQFVGGDTLYAYQSGIDNDYLNFEPGRLIMIATLRDAIQAGLRQLDLLRGDEWYKQHWRAEPHCATEVSVLRRGFLPGLQAGALRLVDWVKEKLRPLLRAEYPYPAVRCLSDLHQFAVSQEEAVAETLQLVESETI